MSHLVEEYAKACGVKVGHPYFKTKYAAIPFEKYIVVYHGSCLANTYKYWSEVFFILQDNLKSLGIKVIQILEQEEQRIEGLDFYIKPSLKQSAFIIDNSLCLVCVDSIYAYFASALKKKQIIIFSHTDPKISGPIRALEGSATFLNSEEKKGKTFDPNETPQTINSIKPETIANSIAKANNWESPNHKTIYIGDRYGESCQDVIPVSVPAHLGNRINVRMDIHHNESVLEEILKSKQVEVTLASPIPQHLLLKKAVGVINYLSHEFDDEFVKSVQKSGIKINLICVSESSLAKERVKFFDMEVFFLDLQEKILKNSHKLSNQQTKDVKIFSKKQILVGEKIFNNYLTALDSKDLFLLDLDWVMLYDNNHE